MARLAQISLCAALVLLPAAARAEQLIFESPRVKGVLLDWCYSWAKDCGQLPADRFCALNGLGKAADFERKNGPLGEPTRLISTGAFCDEDYCATYEYIACTPAPKAAGYFEKPMIKGQRVDWCYALSDQCGEKAANRFCSSQGFAKAASYQIEENIGTSVVLSTGETCAAGKCDGFAFIQCKK